MSIECRDRRRQVAVEDVNRRVQDVPAAIRAAGRLIDLRVSTMVSSAAAWPGEYSFPVSGSDKEQCSALFNTLFQLPRGEQVPLCIPHFDGDFPLRHRGLDACAERVDES